MASLASINIRFSADLEQFSKQMENVNRSLTRTGRNLQRVGTNLSASITLPLVGLGAVAIKTAADLETLKTSLDTVFKGDQELSTQAFEDIKNFAATTPFQLEEVATAFIKLKNLGLDPSIDSLTSYGNTASALGKSLDQMIEAVADASVSEFERLKEFGIKAKSEGDNVSFTFQGVTTTVKKNSEDIQEYLLNIGNTNFAGSIERQAQTFNGKLSTLRDNIAQAFAGIGEIIIDYINPLFETVNGLIKRFNDLSPTTKKWIVIIGGIAAAIGPLLALSGTILPAIGTGLTLLTGPIGLVIAGLTAIGVVIYKNWEPIKRTLIDIANYFIDLYNESVVFRVGVESVIAVFKTLFEIGKFVFETLKNIIGNFIDNFTSGFKSVGKIIKAVFTGNLAEIPDIIKEAGEDSLSNFSGFTAEMAKDWENLVDGIKETAKDSVFNIKSRAKIKFLEQDVDASGVEDAVKKAVDKGTENINVPTKTGLGTGVAFDNQIELDNLDADIAELESLDELLASTGQNFRNAVEDANVSILLGQMSNQYEEFINETDNSLIKPFEERLETMSLIANNISSVFQGLASNMISSLGLAGDGFEGFAQRLLQTGIELVSMLVQNAIKNIAIRQAESVSNAIAGATASAAATGPGALFAQPAFIATAVSGVLAAFAAIPKFATGGIVGGSSFYGDKILARVNSGELILNQRQQRNLAGALSQGNDVNFSGEFKLHGSDLIATIDRATRKQNRRS